MRAARTTFGPRSDSVIPAMHPCQYCHAGRTRHAVAVAVFVAVAVAVAFAVAFPFRHDSRQSICKAASSSTESAL